MATKLHAAQERLYHNMFVCKHCKAKIRADPRKIIERKVTQQQLWNILDFYKNSNFGHRPKLLYHDATWIIRNEWISGNILRILSDSNIKKIALAGGVAANSEVRKKFFEQKNNGFMVHAPEFMFCADNAAMVASAAYFGSNIMCELDVEVFSRVLI